MFAVLDKIQASFFKTFIDNSKVNRGVLKHGCRLHGDDIRMKKDEGCQYDTFGADHSTKLCTGQSPLCPENELTGATKLEWQQVYSTDLYEIAKSNAAGDLEQPIKLMSKNTANVLLKVDICSKVRLTFEKDFNRKNQCADKKGYLVYCDSDNCKYGNRLVARCDENWFAEIVVDTVDGDIAAFSKYKKLKIRGGIQMMANGGAKLLLFSGLKKADADTKSVLQKCYFRIWKRVNVDNPKGFPLLLETKNGPITIDSELTSPLESYIPFDRSLFKPEQPCKASFDDGIPSDPFHFFTDMSLPPSIPPMPSPPPILPCFYMDPCFPTPDVDPCGLNTPYLDASGVGPPFSGGQDLGFNLMPHLTMSEDWCVSSLHSSTETISNVLKESPDDGLKGEPPSKKRKLNPPETY